LTPTLIIGGGAPEIVGAWFDPTGGTTVTGVAESPEPEHALSANIARASDAPGRNLEIEKIKRLALNCVEIKKCANAAQEISKAVIV